MPSPTAKTKKPAPSASATSFTNAVTCTITRETPIVRMKAEKNDRLDLHLQTWRARRGGARFQARLFQLLPGRSQNRILRTKAQGPAGSVLGNYRADAFCRDLCHARHPELEIHLFSSAILLFRAQPFLLERLLPALSSRNVWTLNLASD